MDGPGATLLVAALALLAGAAIALLATVGRRPTPTPEPPPDRLDTALGVLEIAGSAFAVLDVTGDVLHASPLAYSYGLVRAVDGRVPRLTISALRERASEVAADGVLRERTLTVRPAVQGGQTVHVRLGRLTDGTVLLVADDLTGSARVEATRRDFVANVSHELKTPVGAIRLLAETLEDAADDPEAVRRFAGRMHSESARLTSLVQEIIDLSRVQAGTALQDAQEVRVADVVADAVARHRTLADGSGITLIVGEAGELTVHGSRADLATALGNLIANAIAYSSPSTRVGIGVRLAEGMAEIAVTDQGIGIAPEHLSRVFERFFRVDRARSRATGGSGLGLSIVKHIATDHGGEVTAWSLPGSGSTFTLRIPALATRDGIRNTSGMSRERGSITP